MQEENKDIYQDLFSRAIREKLEDHRLPVDGSDWLAMQERIKQANPPTRKPVLWNVLRIGVAAAAVVALTFYLLPIPELTQQDVPGARDL